MAKAKDGSECYTRTNKSGGKYVTCEGTQKGGVKMSANKKVTLEQQKRTQKKKKDNQAMAKADKAIKEASDRIKKKKAAKAKPKSNIGGYSGQKVNVGTLNKGSLNTSKPTRKTKAKTKAGEVTITYGKRSEAPKTFTYKIPKHSVNQSESIKILKSVMAKYDKGEYKFAQRTSLGTIKYVSEDYGSNEKPRILDAKLTFKEGEKKGTISYKELSRHVYADEPERRIFNNRSHPPFSWMTRRLTIIRK